MTTYRSSIDHHPDLLALREKYERAGHSMAVQGPLGLALLFALYTAMSPWIVGFAGSSDLAVIDLIAGIGAAVLALAFSTVLDRTHGIMWTLPAVGVWTIIAPWVHTGAGPDASMIWSNIVSGAAITVLGLAATGLAMQGKVGDSPRRG